MEASVRQEKEELRKKENKLKKKSIDDQKSKERNNWKDLMNKGFW